MPHNKLWEILALDWDGPCVQSAKVYYASIRYLCRYVGIKSPSFDHFRNEINEGVDQFCEAIGVTKHVSLKEAWEIRSRYVAKHGKEMHFTPGIKKLFLACARISLPIIIVSTNDLEVIERKLGDHHLRRFKPEIMSGKDKEKSLKKILGRSGFARMLLVEDSSRNIRIANRLNISTVAFLGGYETAEKLFRAYPTFTAKRMSDVVRLITQ